MKLYNGFGHKSWWPLLGCYKYKPHLYIKANNNAHPKTAQIQNPLKNAENLSYSQKGCTILKRDGERYIILYWDW